ncbi:MAG: 5'/3'-nucleotidase SurE [Desulfurococcales archaeon]|nr:5'/3'-nucleotidase SurE [Desulfurococcales archaeon]
MDKKILVTNDDGVYSLGLKLLYDAVRPLGRTIVFAPETPKSSSGLGITLHKPLRVYRVRYWDVDIYLTNGTPSDIIYLALNEAVPQLDLVVSGVNIGDNTSVQVVLSSGTVGAAAQAALLGIPAIAFSAAVEDSNSFADPDYYQRILRISRSISEYVLDHGMPRDVQVLNVNFPRRIRDTTQVKIARMASIKFLQRINVSFDPRGNKYYWMYGTMAEPEPGTDVHVVHVEENVAITPISFQLLTTDSIIERNEGYFNDLIARLER